LSKINLITNLFILYIYTNIFIIRFT